jgi:hypothetical protein
VDDPEANLRSLLTFLATEKSTAVNRMQTSFNWAFGILSVFTVGVVSRQDFEKRYLSWFMLSVALVLLSHFFVRTAKDYVNQIRFAGLQKHCLACLFSLPVSGSSVAHKEVASRVEQYFIAWKSPKPRSHVVAKTLFDHGFFPLFAVVLTLMAWVGLKINWNDFRPFTTLVFLAILETLILNDFRGFYFECDREEESMKGKD